MGTVNHSGGCLCGGVRYVISGKLRDVWYCHCEHCRRITGHHMAASAAPSDQFAFEADSSLTWYSHQPDVEYGFCRQCGSSLFWRSEGRPQEISICAGTLDDTAGLTTAGVLFKAEAAGYITVHPDVPTEEFDRRS
ncbi:MAG: GFA family protein [Actinomycetia bacterium]|nr:GFA family protein [Actinomycetes bacterium]